MTDKLPPMLLPLFAPRQALLWRPHMDYAPEQRRTMNIGGIGEYLQRMREEKDQDNYVPTESWLQRKDRLNLEKKAKQEQVLKEGDKCAFLSPPPSPKELNVDDFGRKLLTENQVDATKDPKITGDPFKTLFVARLSYDVEAKDLEREFGRFGPIESVCHANFLLPRDSFADHCLDSHRHERHG